MTSWSTPSTSSARRGGSSSVLASPSERSMVRWCGTRSRSEKESWTDGSTVASGLGWWLIRNQRAPFAVKRSQHRPGRFWARWCTKHHARSGICLLLSNSNRPPSLSAHGPSKAWTSLRLNTDGAPKHPNELGGWRAGPWTARFELLHWSKWIECDIK